jgi:uncharacterized membrane protein YphA (DoxX/SURF4 family)
MTEGKGRKIGYWVTTALVGLGFIAGGVADLMASPEIAQQFTSLGYPVYLLGFLGVAKLLGAAAILAPKLPRLKEWAYAGIAFDLLGATYSHAAHGDPIDQILTPAVFLAVAFASYFLRPADRKLPDAPGR